MGFSLAFLALSCVVERSSRENGRKKNNGGGGGGGISEGEIKTNDKPTKVCFVGVAREYVDKADIGFPRSLGSQNFRHSWCFPCFSRKTLSLAFAFAFSQLLAVCPGSDGAHLSSFDSRCLFLSWAFCEPVIFSIWVSSYMEFLSRGQ